VRGTIKRAARSARTRGALWTILAFAYRRLLELNRHGTVVRHLQRYLIRMEKRRFIVGPGTISAMHHTTQENRDIWDGWDWSRYGEEWTDDVKRFRGLDPELWKSRVEESLMLNYARPGGTFLEIGPGAGRWTTKLRELAGRLILADISQTCLDLCRQRFGDDPGVDYILTDGRSLPEVDAASVDFIWSYDVFIHVNPTDTDRYLSEFARVLKVGGYASIHHAGTYEDAEVARQGFRSHLDARFFAHMVRKNGLSIVTQESSLAHLPGDVVTVITKGPGSP
jgi:ubiquinone/menaquinone biosynthesis C-methylase UbiE